MATTTNTTTCWDVWNRIAKITRRALFIGHPGIGKTFAALQQSQTVYSLTCHPEMCAAEVRGHFLPRGSKYVWHYGPGLMAWGATGEPGTLILNELPEAGPDVKQLLYALLDDEESARLTLPDGRTYRPSTQFRAIATTNEQRDALPEALLDRFDAVLEFDRPAPGAIASLPANLQNLATELAAHADADRRISLRRFRALAHYLEAGIDPVTACAVTLPESKHGELADALQLQAARNDDNDGDDSDDE